MSCASASGSALTHERSKAPSEACSASPCSGATKASSGIGGSSTIPGTADERVLAALRTFVEIAVASEVIRKPEANGSSSADADAYDELFMLLGVRDEFDDIVSRLVKIGTRCGRAKQEARVLRFAHQVAKELPSKLTLPDNARAMVEVAARRRGLYLTPEQVDAVLKAASRQERDPELPRDRRSRATRIANALGLDAYRTRTLDYQRSHLNDAGDVPDDASVRNKAPTPGKVKHAEQLDVAFCDGFGDTAHLQYFLKTMGPSPDSAELAALEAWNRAIHDYWASRD